VVTFFAQAKESDSRQGANALDFDSGIDAIFDFQNAMLSRFGASRFSCVAKKSNQKKATLTARPPQSAAGAQANREFSEGTSMCRPKTARIVRAAPQGLTRFACRTSRDW